MKEELLVWLSVKLAEAEKAVRAREQMEETWSEGTDASWKAVGCKLNKAARLKESATQGRIAAKCRAEVRMFKAILNALEEAK